MKISCRRLSAFRTFGKPRTGGKALSETSETSAPTKKCFPKLREVPRRRKNAFRNFGKLRGGGKALSETSETSAPTEKRFPKLRESPRRRKSTFRSYGISPAGRKYKKSCHNKLATALLLSIKNRLSQERNQDTGSHSRTDNTRNVTCHTILKHMVLRIVFQRNLIGHTRCHRHST